MASNLDEFPFARKSKFNKGEALLRTRLLLAVTLVHEVCHALYFATREDNKKKDRFEYFYRDYRLPETGSTLESLLLGGEWEIHGQSQPIAAPYGLSISRWPGAEKGSVLRRAKKASAKGLAKPRVPRKTQPVAPNREAKKINHTVRLEIQGPIEAGVHYNTFYLIPMSYVHQFFTDRFWEKGAMTGSGLEKFHAERRVGMRRFIKKGDVTEQSPRPLEERLSPKSPASHGR